MSSGLWHGNPTPCHKRAASEATRQRWMLIPRQGACPGIAQPRALAADKRHWAPRRRSERKTNFHAPCDLLAGAQGQPGGLRGVCSGNLTILKSDTVYLGNFSPIQSEWVGAAGSVTEKSLCKLVTKSKYFQGKYLVQTPSSI